MSDLSFSKVLKISKPLTNLMQLLKRQYDLRDVNPDLVLEEMLSLVEMGEQLAARDVVW